MPVHQQKRLRIFIPIAFHPSNWHTEPRLVCPYLCGDCQVAFSIRLEAIKGQETRGHNVPFFLNKQDSAPRTVLIRQWRIPHIGEYEEFFRQTADLVMVVCCMPLCIKRKDDVENTCSDILWISSESGKTSTNLVTAKNYLHSKQGGL